MTLLQVGRVGLLALWVLGLTSFLMPHPAPAWRFVGMLTLILGLVHLIEFATFASKLRSVGGSMAVHFIQALIFGLLYLVPATRDAPEP